MKKKGIAIVIITAILIGLVCQNIYAAVSNYYTKTYDGTKSSSNASVNNYTVWSKINKSYLYKDDEGYICRVEYTGNKIIVEKYDSSFNLKSTKEINMELPKFGGFYYGKNNIFIVFGDDNSNESDSKEVLRVVKYTKNWEKVSYTSMYGENTTSIFYAGSLRMDEDNGNLYIETSHKMYKSSDGLNHQANYYIQINEANMSIVTKFTDVMNIGFGYVSHSFNQFIKAENGSVYKVDHGDAYPRSVVLTKTSSGKYIIDSNTNILSFQGTKGANATGASVGGMELSSNNVLVVGNSVDQSNASTYSASGVRNVFLGIAQKNDITKSSLKWITSNNTESAKTPQLVKINDNKFLIMWESTTNKVSAVLIDENGNYLSKVISFEGNLSDCQPILYNNKVIWYVTQKSNAAPTFYHIDTSSKATFENYDGSELLALRSISFENSSYEIIVNQNKQLNVIYNPTNTTDLKTLTWKSSDESIATVNNLGIVTAKKTGTVTISATSTFDSTILASCSVKVIKPLEGINFENKVYTISKNSYQKLNIIYTPQDTTDSTLVTYTSSDENIATVSSSGSVRGVNPGKCTITAVSKANGSLIAKCEVNVVIPISIIYFNYPNQTFNVGVEKELSVNIYPIDATESKELIWSSEDTSVVTVNQNGVAKAVGPGKTNIIVTLKSNPEITDKCTISVIQPITDLKFTEENILLDAGKTKQLNLIYEPSNTNAQSNVNYYSSKQNVATVDKNGVVTAVASGKATVRAYYYNAILKKTISKTCNIIVPEYDSIGKIVISSLGTVTLEKTDFDYGEEIVLPNIVSVVYAGKTLQYGKDYTITSDSLETSGTKKITVTGIGNYSGTIEKSIYRRGASYIQSIALSEQTHTFSKIDETTKLTVKYTPETNINKTLTWTSSNENVATVNSDGTVKVVGYGTATITALTVNGKKATCTVTVVNETSTNNNQNNTSTDNTNTDNTNTDNTNSDNTNSDNTNSDNTTPDNTTKVSADVKYRTHVQNIGWQNYVSNGAMSGTSGQSLRLEGLKIKIDKTGITGGVEYSTHVQNIGWQGFVEEDQMSGTSGRSLRLEAIKIRLTGDLEKKYDIYYRVHCQNFGWLGWAKNGEAAGSEGYSYRLEGIQIELVEKDGKAPGSTSNYFHKAPPTVNYRTHVQNVGWQNYVSNGAMSGTSGQSLRLEGININISNSSVSGGIEYATHVQNIGWQNYVRNGAMSGTSGRSLRLEAIKIRLTGDLEKEYDIYYRVHCQNFGWMGWAKNGASAGSAGFSYRLEGIQIVLVEKGKPAPGSTANSFVSI